MAYDTKNYEIGANMYSKQNCLNNSQSPSVVFKNIGNGREINQIPAPEWRDYGAMASGTLHTQRYLRQDPTRGLQPEGEAMDNA